MRHTMIRHRVWQRFANYGRYTRLVPILVLVFLCGMAQADPVLFFTDITSGPKTGGQDNLGAFISIYGEGFGALRGSSTVRIGGTEVAKYVIWGENNGVARNLDMIVIQPGAGVSTGNIVVTVDGKPSNPLPFTVRAGNIYFVIEDAPNASDTNPGTYAEPYETPYRQPGEMSAGDIVYIKGGTFDTMDPRYPGWDCAICFFLDNDPNGTANAPVAWIGYPGDRPVLGAPAPMRRSLFVDGVMQNYVIANMEFMDYGATIELRGDSHRIIGNYAHDGIYSNSGVIGITGDSAHYKIYGNYLRNNGEPGDKLNGSGFYLQGFGTNQDIDFGWNQIQDQRGARAIQVYGHIDGDFVDNVLIHDNILSGSELNNMVLGGSDGSTNILGTVHVFNNIIIGAGDPGLRVNDPNGTVIIENNVLYNNGTPGLNGSNSQLYLERAGVGKITFRNNIVYPVVPQTYVLIEAPAGDAAIVANNNLYFNAGQCPDFELGCIHANPMFVNPAASDFHLQANSPAINAGANTGIVRDFEGTSRPQGAAYDIGVFEYKQVVLGIIATPSSVNFGNIVTGDSSLPELITISNTGANDIHVGTIAISGTFGSEFTLQNDQVSQQTLSPAQNRTLEVVFTPAGNGPRTASIEIPSDDPNTPVLSVGLQGAGTSPPLWFDTFSDGDVSDWLATKGTWTSVNDELNGTYDRKADIIAPFAGCQVCLIEADLRVDTPEARASLLAWHAGKGDLLEIRMMEDKDRWLLVLKANGKKVAKAKVSRAIVAGTDYRISARFNGSSLQVFIDNELIQTINAAVSLGTVGFRVKSTTHTPATISSREIYAYP